MTTDALPTADRPFYSHSFPKERLTQVDKPFDGITFSVLSSAPAPVQNDGTVSRKPFTFVEPDPARAGYVSTTTSWLEIVTIEFTIWSKSNPTRSKLLNWFHRFMMRYGASEYKYFEAHGADKFQFVARGEDGFETREEQEVYYGTLTYQVRVQLLDNYSERQLNQLTVDVQLGQDQQTILQTA